MKRIAAMKYVVAALVLMGCVAPGCRDKSRIDEGQKPAITDAQYRKDMEEARKTLKGDVRIKLKKDGKGAYSWEITGRDAQEVIKTNSALANRLSDGPKE